MGKHLKLYELDYAWYTSKYMNVM